MIPITDAEFERITTYLKSNYGLNLTKKRTLIESRLSSTLAERGFTNYNDYFTMILADKTTQEMSALMSKLTTNHTYFLRESEHFNYFANTVLPQLEKNNADHEIRIWSAGCSSGEEPYTLAMVIADYFGRRKALWNTKILATDISTRVLEKAKNAIYPDDSIQSVPEHWKEKYFDFNEDGTVTVSRKIREEVIYKQVNLMDNFIFRKDFDVIFCRNVMIYFDAQTKEELISKYYNVTRSGGYLFIGHAETINREKSDYKYIMPAIYQKP